MGLMELGGSILTFVGNMTEFLLHEIPNKIPPRVSQLKGLGLNLPCLAPWGLGSHTVGYLKGRRDV